VPMLGLLPEVRSKRESPETVRATAHGIHHLRVMLCAERTPRQAYLVTSAAEGEGKTSLAVALAMSFAATRRRTLLIDADFVGQRVTRGFGREAQEGLFESLADGKVTPRVHRLEPGLDILSAGKAGNAGAFGVTNESVRAVLADARKHYDQIIIDSGPILGSLEASMFSPEVDSVILAVARGQQHSLMEGAIRRLHGLGADIAGVVFNRAKLRDFHSSAYSSVEASSRDRNVVLDTSARVHMFERFGPLVQAVAQVTPAAAA
jgi:polysaccharide biosynthesis transport protein